jgi:hypothetical protein
MPYRLPAFNLTVRIFASPPPLTVPRVITTGNLSPGYRSFAAVPVSGVAPAILQDEAYLSVAKGVDIRGASSTYIGDMVECPTGTGRYYRVLHVEDVAKGFPNEYRRATMVQNLVGGNGPVWPVPTP